MTAEQDAREQLEQALKKRQIKKYILRLYITGATPKSKRAIANMRKLCDEYLKDRCELEIIDIYRHPERARDDQIIAAPTLVKKLPLPLRRYIGDLSDSDKILVGLEIKEEKPNHK
jgi:circadian clock protein KaiB